MIGVPDFRFFNCLPTPLRNRSGLASSTRFPIELPHPTFVRTSRAIRPRTAEKRLVCMYCSLLWWYVSMLCAAQHPASEPPEICTASRLQDDRLAHQVDSWRLIGCFRVLQLVSRRLPKSKLFCGLRVFLSR